MDILLNKLVRKPSQQRQNASQKAIDKQQANTASSSIGGIVTLLVIQGDDYDWKKIFNNAGHHNRLQDGREIRIVQVGWDDIHVQVDSGSPANASCLVHYRTIDDKERSTSRGTIQPDFVLIRNEVRGINNTQDWRNVLYGLMYANIPSVNSLSSVYSFLERPIVQAELYKIQSRLGNAVFPVIPQSYFSSHSTMMYGRSFPAVLKVGHAHAGYGKLRIANHHDFEDVRSVVAVADGKYCTVEPYLEGSYDIRIQKIGSSHYRAYRRTDISGTWKTNTGCSVIEEVELTDQYKLWVDESSQMFGGLDICTVDAIHEKQSGKEYILEVNGTSSGLLPDHAGEDNAQIRDLVLTKMNHLLVAGDDTA